jgi:hypothetical protein
MEDKIGATRHEFQTQLKKVEVRAKRRGGKGDGTGTKKPPKFDGSKPWTVFCRQFKTVAEKNCWTSLEKSTQLITTLQGPATDVLYGVTKGTTDEETI